MGKHTFELYPRFLIIFLKFGKTKMTIFCAELLKISISIKLVKLIWFRH